MPINLLYMCGALVTAYFGVVLVGLALFIDRSPDRKRCCKCWYSMEHAMSLRCPECGYEASSEAALYKTRRHWKWVMAALLPLLLSGYLAVQPKVNRDGWGSIMPSTALILLVRASEREWALNMLEDRVLQPTALVGQSEPELEEQLWKWQWRVLGRSLLSRLQRETRPNLREKTHNWLALCSRFAQSSTLQYAILEAHARDFGHPDYYVRISAVGHVIRPFENAEFQDDVMIWVRAMRPLLDHEDDYVRQNATLVMILSAERDVRAMPQVIAGTRHHYADVRNRSLAAIVKAAGHHDSLPGAYEAVVALEHDEDDMVRYWQVIALASLQTASDRWHTIETALRSADPYVRRGGLAATFDRSDWPMSVVSLVLDCLDDPDPDVQSTADHAWYVAADALTEHAEMLRGYLYYESENIRRSVAYVLSKLNDE